MKPMTDEPPFADASSSARFSFERWISAPPYERKIERWSQDETQHAWPGQYKDIAVQLAWESWQQSQNKDELHGRSFDAPAGSVLPLAILDQLLRQQEQISQMAEQLKRVTQLNDQAHAPRI